MPAEANKRRPASLALRVTAFVGVATTLVFLIFAWGIEHSIEQHFAEQDLDELRAVAQSIQAALSDAAAERDRSALEHQLAGAVAGHHGVFFLVLDGQGRPLYDTAGRGLADVARTQPAAARLDTDALRIWTVRDRPYRGTVLRMGAYTVLLATAMESHVRYLSELRHRLLIGTLSACAVAILVAWLAGQWGHAPIRRISDRMRSVTSEQLHVRLDPGQVPIELAELVSSFNAMLERIEESFRRLSHFAADIAHELRTPVTNLSTQTQVALSKARSLEAYREILYSNLEEYERMGKMIGDMLFLAQADRDLIRPELADVDLADEVQGLFEYFEAWAEDRGVALALRGEAPSVRGDRLMLRRALSNLMSNAIRHTPSGQTVAVTLARGADWIEVQMENPGPEIPAEHLPRIFDRFHRVDPSRQRKGDGAGLGLAIVKSIVEAHGGAVSAVSAAGRTRFLVKLPRGSVPSSHRAS
ncbi:sensory histidine kinase in two-component regulatory system with CusR, senses copper ions [Thiomonas sp. X19]|uniref:Cu(+)/Ag(+) sensor histidine kinase n=1 Tax=Thiomonas sp. X19 TaxID=1050370 RepID=UPI000B64DAAD|nr:Cu(+)/Ag(+) sensor histidine kinase [Thiomonas sp. X19]SCC94112.1 sensory histidine kinase in two-component regulatory system with CusR, senses copper ions [Thiomonas sp. X19]